MKKKILIPFFISILAISGCKGKNQEDNSSIKSSISFDRLKQLSVEPTITKLNNYNIVKTEIDMDGLYNYSFVLTPGSELCVYPYKEEQVTKYKIDNVVTRTTIDTNILKDKIYNGDRIEKDNDVCYIKDFPLAFYAIESGENFKVRFVDPYGNTVFEEEYLSEVMLSSNQVIKYKGSMYLKITDNYLNEFIFKANISSNKYQVSSFDSFDYKSILMSLDEVTTIVSNDAIFDSNGNTVAYATKSRDTYCIYDKTYKYLNSFSLSSFNLGSYKMAILEDKLCFFSSKEYYANQSQRSSETTYKSTLLEVDLRTGKLNYNDNFKYYVTDCFNDNVNDRFTYCYVYYYELNEKGEKNSCLKCAFLDNKVTFDDGFVYDGFTNNVYRLNDNTLIAYYNDGNYYAITKDNRFILDGVTDFIFEEDGNMIYKTNDSYYGDSYYTCKVDDFISSYGNIIPYTYVSKCLYNGAHIVGNGSNFTYGSRSYNVNNDAIKVAKYGIFIVDNAVYTCVDKIIDFKDTRIFDAYAYVNDDDEVFVCFMDFSLFDSSAKYYKFDFIPIE